MLTEVMEVAAFVMLKHILGISLQFKAKQGINIDKTGGDSIKEMGNSDGVFSWNPSEAKISERDAQ